MQVFNKSQWSKIIKSEISFRRPPEATRQKEGNTNPEVLSLIGQGLLLGISSQIKQFPTTLKIKSGFPTIAICPQNTPL